MRRSASVAAAVSVATVVASVVGLAAVQAANAATPANQPVSVPPAGGSTTVTWTGTIPSGANANSDCTAVPDAASDIETLNVSVSGGLYDTTVSTFAFSITWTPNGTEDTSDEILTVSGPDGEVGSGDSSNTTESVTAGNLASGAYKVMACGFANALPQDYMGKLTITSKVKTSGPAAPAQDGPAVGFGVPRVVDPIHVYGEPDIKVGPPKQTRAGDVAVSGPAGTGTQRSVWNISVDNGDSWRLVQNVPEQTPGSVPAKESNGPGGGDTELIYDHTGKLFYDDLYALVCFTAATTPDSGATVNSNANGCANNVTADRQWYGIYDPQPSDNTVSPYTGTKPLLYLEYNAGGALVNKSTDGLHFSGSYTYAGEEDSPILVDQHTGKVFAAITLGGKLGLATGTPDAAGDLTFDTRVIVNSPLPGSVHTLFPVITQDKDRNLYIVYIPSCGVSGTNPAITDDACFHVYYTAAHASTGWTDWFTPRRIDAPPSVTSVMPWAAAGKDGILDVVWYGADRRENPSTVDAANDAKAWTPYLTQITGADSSAPSYRQAPVSPHPTHYNSICLNGTGCILAQGDRNLADFFQVTIDNDGRARIVYDDTSNGLIQQGFAPTTGLVDHAGAPVVTVGTQNVGVNNLTGAPLVPFESTAPSGGVDDPTGDALVTKPLGGTNAPGADITHVGMARDGDHLTVTVKTKGGSLASAATAAGTPFGQLLVRWQQGTDLYYAEVEQDAAGATTSYYAGKTQSIDLCSVSACIPHYLTYPGPPQGGSSVSGDATIADGGSTYTITVPLSAVGDPAANALFEQVAGYGFAAPQSATMQVTNAQAQAEEGIPLEIEGTKSFNFQASAAPETSVPEAPLTALLPLVALAALGAGYLVRRRRLTV